MKNNYELTFDKGIKSGILTKNGKQILLETISDAYDCMDKLEIVYYYNGIIIIGRLIGCHMHGNIKNKYVLINSSCSINYKKIHVHHSFCTRDELKTMHNTIGHLLERTKSKKKLK